MYLNGYRENKAPFKCSIQEEIWKSLSALTFAGIAKKESKCWEVGMTRKKNLVCGSGLRKAMNADLAVSDSAALGMCASGRVVPSCLHFVYADTPKGEKMSVTDAHRIGRGPKKKLKKERTRSSAAKHARVC